MAVRPIDETEEQPTPVKRAVAAVSSPKTRTPALLAALAAAVALAPFPFDAVGAALSIFVALELTRKPR